MLFRNSLNIINSFQLLIVTRLRKFYFSSSFYNNKISKVDKKTIIYRPNPSILDCIVKYNKKKIKIEEFDLNSIWKNNLGNDKSFKSLNNFFWLFSIDLKSSPKLTQSIIENWIDSNIKYNFENWELDVLSKRIISWISNLKLTYENGEDQYKSKFNFMIRKQVNHLINEIDRSENVDDKIVGCTAIILTGLSYKDNYSLDYGFFLLRKIINFSFDHQYFPKSRSIRQSFFYLKYFVLIRELLRDSQNEIPEYLDEIIFYLGQSYNFFWQKNKQSYLFNGNHETNNSVFDAYLHEHRYTFRSETNNIGGYALLQNNKNTLIMDIGGSPERKFSNNSQSGPLSFEFTYLDNKIISNSGYFQNNNHQLNNISRSTAAHSTLIIDNTSVSSFKKNVYGKKYITNKYKVFDKKISSERDSWLLSGSHDGYLKSHGIIHKRTLNFFKKDLSLKGEDILIRKKNFKETLFEIRFHLYPNSKITKTIDNKTILVEIGKSGWKFTCENFSLDIEIGLFFGKKNLYSENQNILISGKTENKDQTIRWELKKI